MYESSAQSELRQLRLESRNIVREAHSRSSGWKVATFKCKLLRLCGPSGSFLLAQPFWPSSFLRRAGIEQERGGNSSKISTTNHGRGNRVSTDDELCTFQVRGSGQTDRLPLADQTKPHACWRKAVSRTCNASVENKTTTKQQNEGCRTAPKAAIDGRRNCNLRKQKCEPNHADRLMNCHHSSS